MLNLGILVLFADYALNFLSPPPAAYSHAGEEYFCFVIGCQINTYIRSTYVSPYYWRKPSMSKFIEFMTCDRCNIISKLAVFIFESLKLLTEP